MQIIIGSTSQWLIEVQLAGWPIIIIPERTFELSFQAFLSQVMNKNVQTSGSSSFSFILNGIIGFRKLSKISIRHHYNLHHVIYTISHPIPIARTDFRRGQVGGYNGE